MMAELFPKAMAEEILKEIDPNGKAPELARTAAMQYIRRLCGDNFRESGRFQYLQRRYPVKRTVNGKIESVYVLLECLTEAELRANIQRLKREAASKRAHAHALDAYLNTRKHAGQDGAK